MQDNAEKVTRTFRTAVAVVLALASIAAHSRGVYQEKGAFIAEAFGGKPPESGVMWLAGEVKTGAEGIMGHPYNSSRVRYWGAGKRTVWVLEEIGKEEFITTGIVVNDGKIELVRILEYRETRGDEVRYGFFTDQFRGAGRRDGNRLDRTIDGISGATLSVHAITRLARLALYLHGRSPHGP